MSVLRVLEQEVRTRTRTVVNMYVKCLISCSIFVDVVS